MAGLEKHHIGLTLCLIMLMTLHILSYNELLTHTTQPLCKKLSIDVQYRTALANILCDLATSKQVICTLYMPDQSIRC